MEYCTLGHILSLWEVLSVQMAKCLTVQKQVSCVLNAAGAKVYSLVERFLCSVLCACFWNNYKF